MLTRRVFVGTIAAASLTAACLSAGLQPANAVTMRTGTVITGTVTSAQFHLPVVGACVYPVLEGVLQDAGALGGDYSIEQAFAGSCTDAQGKYRVVAPAVGAPALPSVRLVVIPSLNSLAGVDVDPQVSHDIVLPQALGTANGTVTQSGTALGASLVFVRDSQGVVVGLAKTAVDGTFSAGVSAASQIQATVQPLGAIGTDTSIDLLTAAEIDVAAGPGVQAAVGTLAIPASSQVTGTVNVTGSTELPWQVVHADCVRGCKNGVVGVTDASGSFRLVVPAGSTMLVGYSGTIVQRTFATSTSLPPVAAFTTESATYGAVPRTSFLSSGLVARTSQRVFTWSGASLESAPFTFKSSYSTATATSAAKPWTDWVTTRSATLARPLAEGQSVCVRVLTLTALASASASNVGASAQQCVARPLDARAMTKSGSWTSQSNGSAYDKTMLITKRKGSALTLNRVVGHRLVVLYQRAKVAGAFDVFVNNTKVLHVSAAGSNSSSVEATTRVIAMKNARVRIVSTSTIALGIDAIAVLP